MFLLIEFCCGTSPSCLKVRGGVVVVVVVGGGGLEQFSVSPRPLGFGFGTKRFGAKGLGPGLDNIFMNKAVKLFLSIEIGGFSSYDQVQMQNKSFSDRRLCSESTELMGLLDHYGPQ